MPVSELMPALIAVLIVVFIIILKTSTTRANNRRRARGEKPLTDEPEIVNVIDLTRRR